jgi:hypothetical protein
MNTTTRPRTPRSRLSALPAHVRAEVNRKLYDGWQFMTVAEWLFAQKADRDIPDLDLKTGDPFSLIWTRVASNEKSALETCRYRISRWYRTWYQDWHREEVQTGQSARLIERVQELTSTANRIDQPDSYRGGELLIRSMLIDAIEQLHDGAKDPDKLIRLAETWSRLS